MTTKKKKPAPVRGRPRKLKDGFIAINVKLTPDSWAMLKARADTETQRASGVVSMSDVARIAIDEWLLACELGQRPSTSLIVSTPKQAAS